jgi:hypothetical protein
MTLPRLNARAVAVRMKPFSSPRVSACARLFGAPFGFELCK